MFALRRACHGPRRLWFRTLSTLPPLPPYSQWKRLFPYPGYADRVFVKDKVLADKLAKSFFADENQSSTGNSDEGRIVIEAFPGPGCLTRSLLKLPSSKIKKLIVLEDGAAYLPYLTPLQEADPRVVVIPSSGFTWSTYTELEAQGHLNDVVPKSWEEELPNLHFVAHLPNSILGDQLTNQLFRHVPERAWLFKYGRVPMNLILSDQIYRRITAKSKDQENCKLGIIANAVTSIKDAVPWDDLQPYKDHFHPAPQRTETVYKRVRPPGGALTALRIIPSADQVIQKGKLDVWDYVLRRMFVLRTTPLRKAITSLGPGASNLLPTVGSKSLPPDQRINLSKKVRDLDIREWCILMKAFDEWPFRPDDLQISDAIYKDVERER